MTRKIIVLLGLPGSGKGTHSALIANQFNVPCVSTGDIFRSIISNNAEYKQELSECINNGYLVPDELVNKIIISYIQSDIYIDGCVLDGYPRTIDQAKYLVQHIRSDIKVFFFDIDHALVIKRILGRMHCALCNQVYNKYFAPPKQKGLCDYCPSSELVVRSDDQQDIILSRIEEYKKDTLPLVELYRAKKSSFFTLDAGLERQAVINQIKLITKKI